MKYLVSLNGKQYEVIVEHHTANVTNVTPFVSERSPKESSIEQKQAEHLGSLGNPPANSRKDLLDWLKALKDEKIVDIRKVYKNGVTDSVIDSYRSYLKQ